MLKYFQIIFLKTPPKGGWLGDHALYTLIEYLLNLCMKRVVGMSYTLDLQGILFLYTHMFSYICMLQISISINFNWYFHLHTYIYMILIVLVLQHLYILKAQIMFMVSLILF